MKFKIVKTGVLLLIIALITSFSVSGLWAKTHVNHEMTPAQRTKIAASAEVQLNAAAYDGHTAQVAANIASDVLDDYLNRRIAALLLIIITIIVLGLIALLIFLVKRRNKAITNDSDLGSIRESNTVLGSGQINISGSRQGKKKGSKRIILIILIAFLALILFAYVGSLYFLGQMEREDISRVDEELGIDGTVGDPKITNIAVFGIDSHDGMSGRSDAIMILTLDEKHEKIKITSIMRDSYVDIPGRGLDKINHAYAYGGPELAIRTINQNFGLDIRHFMSVNFSSMPAIIDAIGGVEITLTDKEAGEISGISSGGTHILNGSQALAFSRIRKIDSDFERTRRQRDVMESTIEAALNTPMTSYPGMLADVFPHLTTNFTSNRMLNLGLKAVLGGIDDIEQKQFPPPSLGSGETIGGIYYYVFDREQGARILSDYIYRDIDWD